MTREEIKTLARDLNYNVRFGGGDINGDAIQIENVLVALVRATLEEAARAVCSKCAEGPLSRFDYDGWYHETPRGAECCNAPEIHDLIAALEVTP